MPEMSHPLPMCSILPNSNKAALLQSQESTALRLDSSRLLTTARKPLPLHEEGMELLITAFRDTISIVISSAV